MTEKDMTLDILNSMKADISALTKALCECSDLNLRQTLRQMCSNQEQAQYELYNKASQLGFYTQPAMAAKTDVSNLKNSLTKSMTELQGAGPVPLV